MLIENGSDVNKSILKNIIKDGATSLYWVFEAGYVNGRCLKDHGVDVNVAVLDFDLGTCSEIVKMLTDVG